MPLDLEQLRACFRNRTYILTTHASDRAARRAILSFEIAEVIESGEVIEDYPDDKYGPSCLIMGITEAGRRLHVQVSYPPQVKIITVYEPSSDKWKMDWRTRKTDE